MVDEKTYEMLWDCAYCGQKKLLGLSQRHCPKCGGPQDATKRYFPPDDERVAVQDHPFVGADVQCPACNAWNSKAAAHCTGCGGPLAQGRAAPLAAAPPEASRPPKKSRAVLWAVLAALTCAVGLVVVLVFWKRGGSFEVSGHTWERSVEIERFGPVHKAAWCDELPSGARVVGRHPEKRGTKKIPDGQDCTKKKKDNGDGTYKEVTECTPKYREDPVMGDRCDYEADQWQTVRTATASGALPADPPRWPPLDLKQQGACAGCEREGKHKEQYSLLVRDPASGKDHTCAFADSAKWTGFKDGARYDGTIGVVSGALDCDSLRAQ
jgi:hypothetical protein